MGFFRGATITLFSILLFICLVLMGLCLSLSLSLQHDTLQPALENSAGSILKSFIDTGNLFGEEEQKYMSSYCSFYSEYNFTYENYNFTFPCEVIENGTDAIISYGAKNFVDQVYYTEYSCEFWQCVKESSIPLVLLSEKSKDYWTSKFILLAVLSLILFVLIFLISRNRSTTFIVTGILLIVSSLPFRKLDWALIFIPKKFSAILTVFFTKAHEVFAIILGIGVLFILTGIMCKIFGWKMKFTKDPSENSGQEKIDKSGK